MFASVGGEVADWVRNAGQFDVEASDFYGTGDYPHPGEGYLLLDHSFEQGTPR